MEPSRVEALDVDDSDLLSLSLLRPCKQQRRHDVSDPSITTHLSLSQTLDSPNPPSPTVNTIPRTIPGPAGIIQAAKLRKTRDNENLVGQEEPPMATQEYIRRVVEDPEEDDDFQRTPWLSAIEFVYGDGMFNSVSNAPLGDINKHLKNGKLHQVVAVIKSCTPNKLGDLMVTLKDPTGAVSGTIHHKVLTEGEFGKGIFVGSVLILHKVSVFSPSRTTHYLNITKRNLVKVFYSDNGPSEKEALHGCKIIDAAPISEQDPRQETTTMSGTTFSLEQIAKKMTNVTKTTQQNPLTHNQQENANPIVSTGPHFTQPFKESNVVKSGVNENPVFFKNNGPSEKQTLHGCKIIDAIPVSDLKQGTTTMSDTTFSLEQIAKKMTNVTKTTQQNPLTQNQQENVNPIVSSGPHTTEPSKESNLANENPASQNGPKGNGPVQVEPVIVSGALPVWTDEQLNELFDDYMDDF